MYEDLDTPIFFTVRDKTREMVRRRMLTKYETRFKNYMQKFQPKIEYDEPPIKPIFVAPVPEVKPVKRMKVSLS